MEENAVLTLFKAIFAMFFEFFFKEIPIFGFNVSFGGAFIVFALIGLAFAVIHEIFLNK